MSNITYTFAANCPIAALRGRTFTGGEFVRLDGRWQDGAPDAVRFAEHCEGKAVVARIAGKAELESALADHQAAAQRKIDRLASIGWPQYKAIQADAYNARAAYDAASERGYPMREAAAMRAADEALVAARAQYPLAAAYAMAEAYSLSANYRKAALGSAAMRAIESGADPIATVATMDAAWADAAAKAVQNA